MTTRAAATTGSRPSAAACSRRKSPASKPWSARPRFTCALPGGPHDAHLLPLSAVAPSAGFPARNSPTRCFGSSTRLSESQGALALFFDGLGSLARQWLLRSGWWKIALALGLRRCCKSSSEVSACCSSAAAKPCRAGVRPVRRQHRRVLPNTARWRISRLPSESSCTWPSSSPAVSS